MEDTHAPEPSAPAEQSESTAIEGAEATASTPAADSAPSADEDSPFGAGDLPVDRGLKIAVWAVGVLLVLVAGYLAWMVFNNANVANTQSPAARAVANLADIVKAQPNSVNARVKLAEALIANDQLDEAVVQLKAALAIDKENAGALVQLGLIAMQRKDYKTAEAYWTNLINQIGKADMAQQDQRLADVYYYLGTVYVETKRYEEAVANLKRSIAIKRDSSPVHYMLSVAYARLGLTDQQESELRIVLAFDPKNAQANYDLGKIVLAKGDVAQAAEYFRAAADNAPDGITLPQDELDQLGTAEQHLSVANSLQDSDPKKALVAARIAAALNPKSAPAVKLVAQLSEQLNDKARALNAWERYLELVPEDAMATEAIKRLSADDQ